MDDPAASAPEFTVTLNGMSTSIPDGATVGDVVDLVAHSPVGCAVAVNGEVVPRSAWGSEKIAEGDRIEVLTAVQGG